MKSDIKATEEELNYLFTPASIRDRAKKIFDLTIAGKTNFKYHPEKLDETVSFVEQVTRENYPDLNIPFHSRWGHFNVGNIDRVKKLENAFDNKDDLCRAKIDLVIVSVLLDAGAGDKWSYRDELTNQTFSRSEGLAVASYNMFCAGVFSNNPDDPYRCDNEKLESFSVEDLNKGFQVSNENPLEGLEGRVSVINRLAEAIPERPGNFIDFIGTKIPAAELLGYVLRHFGRIWPSRLQLGNAMLGDVWQYEKLGSLDSTDSLVPFHKLSQWLTYSLIEPMQEAGVNVTDLNTMTGLPEYRNGGLLLDSGLLSLVDEGLYTQAHNPSSSLIVEWRALTIHLLDIIADQLREKLGMDKEQFPLVKVLEGGTWWAGRKLAAKRDGGGPPLKLNSDGTVF